jgi:nucleotide-binding universal stress UspA family protein
MSGRTETGGEPLLRILHPSDFSKASRVAFAHALKIALQAKAELEIVHVESHEIGSDKDVDWTDFPGVRSTLALGHFAGQREVGRSCQNRHAGKKNSQFGK